MPVLYSNNAATALAASITSTATSFSVVSGKGALFPAITGGDYFYATLISASDANTLEVVKVTARSTDTFTVVRAQDGTTGTAFSAGDKVELRIVKAMLDDFKSDARAGLTAIAALTPTLDNFIVGNGTTWILETPAQARASLGGTTVGQNLFTLTNPSAITFPRINADNTVSALDAASFRTAIAALASSGGTLTGPLVISTGSTNNNYNEGLRLTRAGNNWAGITFGSTGDSGAPTGGWFAATNPSAQFIISPDDSSNTTGLTLNKNGNALWRNNVMLHAGNYTSYSPSLTGSGASGTWGIGITGAVNGITISQNNVAQNVRIQTAGGTDSGVSLYNSSGTWLSQWYGSSGNYGFLNGNWAGWDIRKTVNGELFVTVSSTERTVIHSGNIGSQSVNYANSAGRAYPYRSDGGALNFYWSGQSGQPPWLWGGSDGANMYVYNPSNFSVNYANYSGYVSGTTYGMVGAYTIAESTSLRGASSNFGAGTTVAGSSLVYCDVQADLYAATLGGIYVWNTQYQSSARGNNFTNTSMGLGGTWRVMHPVRMGTGTGWNSTGVTALFVRIS